MGFEEDFENGFDERLVMSTKGEYDLEENALRPKTMADYVGQSKVKENLSVYISSAKCVGRHWIMCCCTGLRGLVRRRLRTS